MRDLVRLLESLGVAIDAANFNHGPYSEREVAFVLANMSVSMALLSDQDQPHLAIQGIYEDFLDCIGRHVREKGIKGVRIVELDAPEPDNDETLN